nr:amino acid permease 6-like [Tanacetum cinerariifolium]
DQLHQKTNKSSTVFYMLCGVLGYIAFGNVAPGFFLIGFGFHDPFWLIDVVNVCIVIHLLGGYKPHNDPREEPRKGYHNATPNIYFDLYMICSKSLETMSAHGISGQANSLTSDCNELLAELIDKDPYHVPSTLTELEDTTHIFQLHFDSESTKRKKDCVLDRVFKHQPLPLPALSVESVTLSSASHGQPEQMPKPKPASPALSTSAINEPDIIEIDTENLERPQFIPPPTQEIIAAQKEDKAANLKPKYDDVTSSMKMEQRTQMEVNSSKKC